MTSASRRRSWDLGLAISAGGAIGAVARYALSVAVPHRTGQFPWATFATNVSGCFFIGVLMVSVTEVAGRPHRMIRPFLGVGLLGGFTTFSTYAVETRQLITNDAEWLGILYFVTTPLVALTAVQVGIVATRLLTRAKR